MMKKILTVLILTLAFTLGPAAAGNAQEPAANATDKLESLDNQIQDLKKEVLELNRDLFLLEEDLLFPANTQFTVFLSMDADILFDLDSVQLRINDKVVANYLYTDREVTALQRGGVQRLYVGNLSSGKHEVVAYFIGQGPKQRDYRRGTTLAVSKTSAPQFVELKISGNAAKQQPEFKVKVWE